MACNTTQHFIIFIIKYIHLSIQTFIPQPLSDVSRSLRLGSENRMYKFQVLTCLWQPERQASSECFIQDQLGSDWDETLLIWPKKEYKTCLFSSRLQQKEADFTEEESKERAVVWHQQRYSDFRLPVPLYLKNYREAFWKGALCLNCSWCVWCSRGLVTSLNSHHGVGMSPAR